MGYIGVVCGVVGPKLSLWDIGVVCGVVGPNLSL